MYSYEMASQNHTDTSGTKYEFHHTSYFPRPMPLKLYHKKRDFSKTSEPKGKHHKASKHRFVVQEHHATRLHFDFRLEMDGVMKSWAVPKGPSMNPEDKHLAVMVEDHPIEYNTFQGTIPEGSYGAGEVRRWDFGTYEAVGDLPIEEQLPAGKLTFILKGKKLKGEFHMVKMEGRGENNWLIFKHKDEFADPKWSFKQILDYGSRSEGKKIAEKKLGKDALEELVAKSKKKRKVAATRRTMSSSKKPSVAKSKPRAVSATRKTKRTKATAK